MLVQRHLHQSRTLQPSPLNAALCGTSGECECVPVQGGPEVCARAGVHKLTTVLHCAVTVFAQGWAVNTNDKDWDLYWSDTDSVFRCTQPHLPHENAAHHPICVVESNSVLIEYRRQITSLVWSTFAAKTSSLSI